MGDLLKVIIQGFLLMNLSFPMYRTSLSAQIHIVGLPQTLAAEILLSANALFVTIWAIFSVYKFTEQSWSG